MEDTKDDFMEIVERNRYFKSFDKFLAENQDISPEMREYVKPVIMELEHKIFSYMLFLK